jgi:hypothetical protein
MPGSSVQAPVEGSSCSFLMQYLHATQLSASPACFLQIVQTTKLDLDHCSGACKYCTTHSWQYTVLLRFMKSLHWSVCRIRMHGSSSSCQPDLLLLEFISAIKTEIYQQNCSSWLAADGHCVPAINCTNSSSCAELITCCNGISTGSRSLTTLVVVLDLHDLVAAAAVLLLEL